MIDEKVFLGFPIEFEKGIKIYPPTINQVLSEKLFPYYKQFLMQTQEEIEDEIQEQNDKNPTMDIKNIKFPTPFEYVLIAASQDKRIEMIIKAAFKFFIHKEVAILRSHKMIILADVKKELTNLNDLSSVPILTEDNFFKFQNCLRRAMGEKEAEPPRPDEDPRIKRMKAKARLRDRVKAKKQGINLATTLVAICCMNLGLTPLNIGEISYAAVFALINMNQQKEKYEIDVQSIMAGAKNVKLKYWIRDFDKD